MLSDDEQGSLKRVAEDAAREFLGIGEPAPRGAAEGRLARPGSCFVTVRREGRLRGCIGLMGDPYPLAECVREATRRALRDPRFDPVAASEFAELTLEVSALTPPEPLSSREAVEVGRHGLLVSRGARSGLLLPQVAVEQGWDREVFLRHVCLKAGLPADALEDPETELFTFEAQVF